MATWLTRKVISSISFQSDKIKNIDNQRNVFQVALSKRKCRVHLAHSPKYAV